MGLVPMLCFAASPLMTGSYVQTFVSVPCCPISCMLFLSIIELPEYRRCLHCHTCSQAAAQGGNAQATAQAIAQVGAGGGDRSRVLHCTVLHCWQYSLASHQALPSETLE
jgi:hypothetical protein